MEVCISNVVGSPKYTVISLLKLDVKAEKGRAMDPTLNRRPLTAKSRDQFQASTRGSFGRRGCTGTDFCPNTSDFPCQ